MFIIKSNYYLYIENTKNIDLNYIRKNKKISIIYRNHHSKEDIPEIYRFRKRCRTKGFKFYIANNIKLLKKTKADGLYVSSFNKKIYLNKNIKIIGSAHTFREIDEKIKQGCKTIFLSRLFKTFYKDKKKNLGLVKFNLIRKQYNVDIIPLGGIRGHNLNKLNVVNSNGLGLLSEVKKKPVIANRLF
jgi:thiamine-phosphate pyrophosphorylase